MITIITGVPGMGKTALAVMMMLKEEKANTDRPFFVMGIPDLLLDHSPVPPVSEWTEKRPDPDDPSILLDYYTFPKNSIIIIDEAQRVFRPRASGSKVPPHVAAQETHRHTGVDFWLLTQKPHLLDSNIKELCGRHIHIRERLWGRYLYEWPEMADVKSRTDLAEAAKRKFSPPKAAFKYYKSAELHTKQPRRFHQAFLFLALALGAFAYFGGKAYLNISKHLEPLNEAKIDDKNELLNPINIKNAVASKPSTDSKKSVTPAALVEIPHPFIGYTFTIKAVIKSASKSLTYYSLSNGDKSLMVTDSELKQLGYQISQNSDCAAFLFFNGAQVVATCNMVLDGAGAALGARHLAPAITPQSSPPAAPAVPLIDSVPKLYS